MLEVIKEQVFLSSEDWEQWLKPVLKQYYLEKKQRISIFGKVVDMLRLQLSFSPEDKVFKNFQEAFKHLNNKIIFPYYFAFIEGVKNPQKPSPIQIISIYNCRADVYRSLSEV